ncbi:hypothetical protein [Solitalea canadensis]|uniref:Prokaryotic RING finger family 4 n=1 Tax=Solitalea canadensis (strain ATCC 29591 / DSM 3403 / JCM 21819 / LMG 8368 / NBRC 15130 / NCIMB 12057 / USAM 9D) TaxID=929556 RepID=H8KLP6_SOLCM|nr:hypothetical protein [Solitalea canadensis]AFD09200.1 hypothetical protein Solca_4210 [Solitalea canadensis DSM 3403]
MNALVKVSIRQQAVFVPLSVIGNERTALSPATTSLVANLASLGYGVSESLLRALNNINPSYQTDLLKTFCTVMGVNKNWTPLVKGWDVPTGESVVDHIVTLFANIFKTKGVSLACGHVIPANTFPLERYNGCPFCGTPFEFGNLEYKSQGSKLKTLELWTVDDARSFLTSLLQSKTPLDATQIDSLRLLLSELQIPEVKIEMKETLMTVIDVLVEQNNEASAQSLFTSPVDIMRYLWYKHTGFLQIIEPKTIIERTAKNGRHIGLNQGNSAIAKLKSTADLKLKYGRKESLMIASWLNHLEMDVAKICEAMHPKRSMWVRFIRALRLAEFSKRAGFEKLREVLDVFYNQTYEVWNGQVSYYRLRLDAENTFDLLKQRPGLFARSLFANMLWFGADVAVSAFEEIIEKVPARLVFTLNMYAENYFDKGNSRIVKPLGGVAKSIPANNLLQLYTEDQLEEMKKAVEGLCIVAMKKRFAKVENSAKTMFIDSMLFKIPVAIGDRSDSIQDMPSALMGTRFKVEGDKVRLFMQWGEGLPAQHLDMDLSCHIAYEAKNDFCSYSHLLTTGCKHSGDIRSIPAKVGTAEYIDIDINQLQKANAQYVTFTCNAYSNGSITPNLVVGWMNSKFPMKVSELTGVAYDPSCVQHQVRVVNNLTKGLIFGVLDVSNSEIIWLEMPFSGQVVQGLELKNVKNMLKKLDSKLSVGQLLTIKAESQNIELVNETSADEVYSLEWVTNTAAVTQLLID